MATPRIISLSRSLFTTTNKQTLTTFLLRRSFTSSAAATSSPSAASLFRLRPLSAVGFHRISSATSFSGAVRTFSTRQSQTSLNDNSPNWSNRPPKETILLDGCDFEHWLVVTEPPPEGATRDEIIDSYIKTLAKIVGSEEEAKMKIYSVSTRCYYAFGALVTEELSYKLKELPNVRWVLPDSYLDVKNKDYGGEPFIDGQAVPYDPKYHEEWIRNNQKANERNRRNDRPRNADRSRNFERRQSNPRGNMGGLGGNMGGPGVNMGGPGGNPGSPPNMGGMHNQPSGAPNMPPSGAGYGQNMPPPNNAGFRQNMPPNNPGFQQNMPPNNPGFQQNMPPNNNAGYGQNMPPNSPGFQQNMPPNSPGFQQNMPPNNPGFQQNMPPNNPGFANAPNRGGMPPPNYGGQGYQNTMPNYQGGGMPYQNAQMPNPPQSNFAPQGNIGGQPGGGIQGQDVPGRDLPHYQ